MNASENIPSAKDMALEATEDTPDARPGIVTPADLHDERDLLVSSPLAEWFPGVQWRPLMTFVGGTVYVTTEADDENPIALLVQLDETRETPRVFFTRTDGWRDGVVGWTGPEVTSAADVGYCLIEEQQRRAMT